MNIHENQIREKLQKIVSEPLNSLRKEVAQEALECEHDIILFFKDLLQNGCISGMITQLIYYHDTHNFYDKHYVEIEELRETYESDFGIPLQIKGDLKNFLAWFAFEETAYQLANELEIEI